MEAVAWMCIFHNEVACVAGAAGAVEGDRNRAGEGRCRCGDSFQESPSRS